MGARIEVSGTKGEDGPRHHAQASPAASSIRSLAALAKTSDSIDVRARPELPGAVMGVSRSGPRLLAERSSWTSLSSVSSSEPLRRLEEQGHARAVGRCRMP